MAPQESQPPRQYLITGPNIPTYLFVFNMVVLLPQKQHQKSRSTLHDRPRFLGLFWEEIPIYSKLQKNDSHVWGQSTHFMAELKWYQKRSKPEKLWRMDIPSYFYVMFTKVDNFFFSVFLNNKALPQGGKPLKERICSYGSKFFLLRVDSFSIEKWGKSDKLFSLKMCPFTLNLPISSWSRVPTWSHS